MHVRPRLSQLSQRWGPEPASVTFLLGGVEEAKVLVGASVQLFGHAPCPVLVPEGYLAQGVHLEIGMRWNAYIMKALVDEQRPGVTLQAAGFAREQLQPPQVLVGQSRIIAQHVVSKGTLREVMVASNAATALNMLSKLGAPVPNTSLKRRTYSGIWRNRSSAMIVSRFPARFPVKADLA